MENIKILNFDDGLGNYDPVLVVVETLKDNKEIIKKAEELAKQENWTIEEVLEELEKLNYIKVVSYDVINLVI